MKQNTFYYMILCLLFWAPLKQVEAQLVVIVNKSNTIDNLTMFDLKQIYLGRVTTFANGDKIVLAECESYRDIFYKTVLGKSLHKVRKHWIKLVLTGKSATPPVQFRDIDEDKEFVSKNSGAISFIDAADTTDSGSKLKVLTIDSKSTTSRDYPLKLSK